MLTLCALTRRIGKPASGVDDIQVRHSRFASGWSRGPEATTAFN